MQKILVVSYSPDPYLLDFILRKTQRKYPDGEISVVLRPQAKDRIQNHSSNANAIAHPISMVFIRFCWI